MSLQLPKGTFDILPIGSKEPFLQSHLWQFIEGQIDIITKEYGYQEIRTPLYEHTELFHRGVGETTDIVSKEMFTFPDRKGRSLTLRPEGTASVMRASIEHQLFNIQKTLKLFYTGPMFRYERPQSGRYRQHHQFGIEAIGIAAPEQDAEVIDLLLQFYQRLKIQNLNLNLNTVGDRATRTAFRAALMDYLSPYKADLSPDSQIRLEKNPLRILDSKDPKDREILKKAPSILSYLSKEADHHFQSVCKALKSIHIHYEINDKIVRGLDYYNHTVFEVLCGQLGAQNTIGAGGRYDGLVELLGGPPLSGIGWATGLERVLQVMLTQNVPLPAKTHPTVYFIPLGEKAKEKAFSLVTECRHHHIRADIELNSKKIQAALQNASQLGATYCAILGDDELARQIIQIKHLESRSTQEIAIDSLLSFLHSK